MTNNGNGATSTANNGRRGSTPVDEKTSKYLRRPEVAAVIDDVISQCIKEMPEDPAQYIYEYLERQVSSREPSMCASGGAVTPPAKPLAVPHPPVVPQPPAPRPSAEGGASPRLQQHADKPDAEAKPAAADDTKATSCDDTAADSELLNWILDCRNVPISRELPAPPASAAKHARAEEAQMLVNKIRAYDEASSSAYSTDLIEASSMSTADKEQVFRAVTLSTAAIINAGSNLTAVCDIIANTTRSLVGAARCTFFMVDSKRKKLTATIKEKTVRLAFGEGLAGTVAMSQKALRVDNAYEHPKFSPETDIAMGFVTKAVLTMPMLVDDKLIAVVQLVNKETPFNDGDEKILELFTSIAGVTIRNRLYWREHQRRAATAEKLAEINAALANNELDEVQLIPAIIRGAKTVVDADRCAFFSVNKDTNTLTAHLEGVQEQLSLSGERGIVGWVAKHEQPLNIPDAYADNRFNKEVDQASGYKTKSVLCFPIIARGELVAVAQVINKHATDSADGPSVFSHEDEETVMEFGRVAGVCMRNCAVYKSLKQHEADLREVSITAMRVSSLGTPSDPKPSLEVIAEKLQLHMQASRAIVYTTVEDVSIGRIHPVAAFPPLSADIYGDQSAAGLNGTLTQTVSLLSPSSGGLQNQSFSAIAEAAFSMNARFVDLRDSANATTLQQLSQQLGDSSTASSPESNAMGSRTESKPSSFESDIHAVLVVPMMDDTPIGAVAIINPSVELAEDYVRLFNRYAREQSSRRRSTAEPGPPVFDTVRAYVSLATFALRVARLVESVTMTGNNLQALMGMGDGKLDDSSDSPSNTGLSVVRLASPPMMPSVAVLEPDQVVELQSLDFNVHPYREGLTPSSELTGLLMYMFTDNGVLDSVKISHRAMAKFLVAVRSRYRDVPYHNFFHAFDVTQTVYALLRMAKLEDVVPKPQQFALLLAAVVHDVDHMGLNNNFHQRADTDMGIVSSLAGHKSVLEVHHCQVTIELVGRMQLFAETPKSLRVEILKTMINCVLATDMAMHKEMMANYAEQLGEGFDAATGGDAQQLLLTMLLKMADISNIAKRFDISRRWGIAVTEEFYRQGDHEREEGLEVTPMFDRAKKAELAHGQIGFINFLGLPFFKLTATVVPAYQVLPDTCESNVGHWKKVLQVHSEGGES